MTYMARASRVCPGHWDRTTAKRVPCGLAPNGYLDRWHGGWCRAHQDFARGQAPWQIASEPATADDQRPPAAGPMGDRRALRSDSHLPDLRGPRRAQRERLTAAALS